ncbi:MAG TPA: NB-ARC domain-containing protein [Ktedonobacteraceae bacterium]|nr:NB-ARC domain-containing protein [Ktedonobacteraceae bacterium]
MTQHLPFHVQFQQERQRRAWSRPYVAEKLGCDVKTVARWESKETFPQPSLRQRICELFGKNAEEMGLLEVPDMSEPELPPGFWEDWEVAPQVTNFYGRDQECADLVQWIAHDHCHMVAVLGIGGVGKTALTRKVAEKIKGSFDFIFWRSLQNAPTLKQILKDCIQFLSQQQQIQLPEMIDAQISLLVHYLRRHRCLLILDNVESILQAGQRAGHYRGGYEEYGHLFQYVGEADHQSCLLLTSREKPREVAHLEGQMSLVRSLPLSGVKQAEGQQILRDKGLIGSGKQWATLVRLYSGNPLALKLVSEFILEVFAGDIAQFLQEENIAFGDINDLLDQHFQRLSVQEQEIMHWLAIEREMVSVEDIALKLAFPVSRVTLREAFHSLRRRSMVEVSGPPALFTLQPVIMEYMTARLVKRACEDFSTETSGIWAQFALMTSQARDYVRDSQIHLILQPVADYLLTAFGGAGLEEKLKQKLAQLRQERVPQSGYVAGNILNLLVHLQYKLRGADFSHLRVRQAHLRNVSLPEADFSFSQFDESTFTNAFGSVLSVAFSPQQDYFATGTATGDIWIYEVQSGTPVFSCQGHTDGVWSVAFSPDGSLLASSSDDQSIRLWDVSSRNGGHCLKTLQDKMDRVRALAFSPDGSLLASGSDDQLVRLWEVQTGLCRNILRGHSNRVWSVAFRPDGRMLASGSTDLTIRLWSLEEPQTPDSCLKIFRGHDDWVRSVAFSPDGALLVSGSDDRTVRLWRVDGVDDQERQATACLGTLQGHVSPVWSVAFSPDGHAFASGSEDHTIRLWSIGEQNSAHCVRVLQDHTHGVRAVAFNRDGRLLASGGEDHVCRVWDASNGHCLKTLQGYTNRVRSLAFSPDSRVLASGNEDQMIHLWSVEGQNSGRDLKPLQDRAHGVKVIAFHPDGGMLASGGEDQTVRLWDTNSGLCRTTLRAHTAWVQAVAFSPDGKTLASGAEDQTICLWEVSSGTLRTTLAGHTSWVRSLAFHPGGQLLASCGDDQTIRLWQLSTGQCSKILHGHTGNVRFVTFSPDGQMLASGSEDQTVRLWDVNTGQEIDVLPGHKRWVRCVAFSPDGRVLASSGDDQTIRLWNRDDRSQPVRMLQGHTDRIRWIAFSPDGRFLASGSDDGSIRLWDWQNARFERTLVSERPYERMNITAVRGLTDAQKASLRTLGAFENA